MWTEKALAKPTFLQSIAATWKNWRRQQTQVAELRSFDAGELKRIASELGLTGADLRRLAKHGPGAADLLRERMAQLKLDPDRIDLAVLRDLQRCCAECESKGRCAHDLQERSESVEWRGYCPNSGTLDALTEEKTIERLNRREEKRKPVCAAWPV